MLDPLDSVVLKLHSTHTSFFLALCWLFVTGRYYTSDVILCVSKFDRSVVTGEVEQMCLTYPFTESRLQSTKYFALHYKWMHWAFLFLALVYKLPYFVKRHVLHPDDLIDVLHELSVLPVDFSLEALSLQRSIWYWKQNYGKHGNLYRKNLCLLIICLLTNIFAFFVINLLFQSHYFFTLAVHWPFARDYQYFLDPLSSLFPPFAKCELTQKMQLWLGRTERIGCHLPFMEIYEKIILILWTWQLLIFILTVFDIFRQLMMTTTSSSKLALLCGGCNRSLLLQKVSCIEIGELNALRLFRRVLTKPQMRCLLYIIARDFFHVQ